MYCNRINDFSTLHFICFPFIYLHFLPSIIDYILFSPFEILSVNINIQAQAQIFFVRQFGLYLIICTY